MQVDKETFYNYSLMEEEEEKKDKEENPQCMEIKLMPHSCPRR